MSFDIAKYLDGEGAVGVLIRLDTEGGLLNGEIEEQVHISPTTLSKRLDEARRHDLIAETRRSGDHGNSQRYVLTVRGEAVVGNLRELDLDDAYEQLFEATQTLNNGKEELQKWLEGSPVTHPDYPPKREPPERE